MNTCFEHWIGKIHEGEFQSLISFCVCWQKNIQLLIKGVITCYWLDATYSTLNSKSKCRKLPKVRIKKIKYRVPSAHLLKSRIFFFASCLISIEGLKNRALFGEMFWFLRTQISIITILNSVEKHKQKQIWHVSQFFHHFFEFFILFSIFSICWQFKHLVALRTDLSVLLFMFSQKRARIFKPSTEI